MDQIRQRILALRAGSCWKAIWVVAGVAVAGALTSANPVSAAPLGGNIAHVRSLLSGSSGPVHLAHKRRYRHCHGSRRCHGRGQYYRYQPTPYVYVPRFYAPYGYGGYGYGYGYGGYGYRNSWGYGGHHYGHHFGGHHGGHHFGGHHGGHH